ncbi:hypothetical protein RRG08_000716 [Elysia crispata]|uniref:Uncharacterized protein n=1 Tax=Elysia crispata TaxID=231223 RepID=A0AAE1E6I6_9GAST|nr:hypothetical protein RRG08_000716 [Elysia crispata]
MERALTVHGRCQMLNTGIRFLVCPALDHSLDRRDQFILMANDLVGSRMGFRRLIITSVITGTLQITSGRSGVMIRQVRKNFRMVMVKVGFRDLPHKGGVSHHG